MHTLTVVADDFVMLARAATRRGFRIVVMLRRGHLGRPLRTPRFNLLGCVDDLRVHLDGIQARSVHWSPYDRVGVVNADP